METIFHDIANVYKVPEFLIHKTFVEMSCFLLKWKPGDG